MEEVADQLAQPVLERLASTTWIGQDEIDPPVAGRSVESASRRGAYYVMLNILAERGIIAYRKDYAPIRPGLALLQISGEGAQRHLIGLPSLSPGFGESCNELDHLCYSRGADAEGALDDARFTSDVMRDAEG
jgi:hypothetical protein